MARSPMMRIARSRCPRPAFLASWLVLILLSGSPGCGAAGRGWIAVANGIARLGNYRRVGDIAYGRDPDHRLDVYTPAHVGPEGAPVIVFFHGGDWSEDLPPKSAYRFVGDAMTARGFVTVICGYRRHPRVRFPSFVEDGAGAIAWTRKHIQAYGGDPDRIFLMGHSAGAHLATLVALDPRYLRAVGGDPTWVRGLVGISGPYSFDALPDEPALRDIFGPENRSQSAQVADYVDPSCPPMLLITGARDTRVPRSCTRRLADRVRLVGAHVETIAYLRLDHIMTIGAFATPVRWHHSVVDDVARFVRQQARGPREVNGLEVAGMHGTRRDTP